MTTQELMKLNVPQLKEEADKQGVEYTEDVSRNDLISALSKFYKAGDQNAGGGENKAAKSGVFYYWLKVKHVIEDGKHLKSPIVWGTGLYRTKKQVERLETTPRHNCEKWEGEVPEVKVYDIARICKVATESSRGRLRSANEILEELVIDM